MAILLCNQFPAMRILDPATGNWIPFLNGKLEIESDHPAFATVMAEASRNPAIVVYESVTTCDRCGETFEGGAAKARLGKHRKDVHYDVWLAEKDAKEGEARMAEIKGREGVPCDACAPATWHPDADALALHVKVMHTKAPEMDDEGNTKGDGEAAALDVTIPAAKPTA